MALDLQSYTATAPGAGAAMAAVTGDSLFIRAARSGSDILNVQNWTKAQAVGTTTLLCTSGHDMVRNWRARNLANQVDGKVPVHFPLHFKPQDALTINQVGSAVAADVELFHMLNWYEDLPGVEANLINVAELRHRGELLHTVENTTTATAGGAYSGSQTIVAAQDQFKADREYAILGAHIGAVCGALCIQAVDFGNLRVGIPGLSGDAQHTANFFPNISDQTGVPCIPVFNSANRNNVFITNVQDENLTAVPYSLILCLLAPRNTPRSPVPNPPN